ncbi:MAG: peptide ABC transporter ATP-binding protein [Deltaproteobacteria bacterium RIFOXYA12_FULL_58_15]|nr:MAG: peptide ABC transporter ATP-binding protein [Deltaproteobacteria bacterium RIFOXYA12_FULL_58_15]
MSGEALLRVRNLVISFAIDGKDCPAVDGITFDLERGRTLALVGESGSGKTLTAVSILGLVQPPGVITGGSIDFDGTELVGATTNAFCAIRGRRVAMVFQEPMAALNPVMRIGDQIAEPLRAHLGLSRVAARDRAIDLLGKVGIGAPAQRVDNYPHQLSGGMRQRVMIAMALSCDPEILIADEPTTALDVTVQRQILALLRKMQRERHMAMLFVTHDLSLVENIADEVAVMYAGRIVERASVQQILTTPKHPYSRALWHASPARHRAGERLQAVPGNTPGLTQRPRGCPFHPRCPRALERCHQDVPAFDASVACFVPHS